MVFADATARDAAVTSPSEGMICYLKDIDQVQSYNGSSWASVTSVLTGDVLTEDSTNLRVGINEASPGAALQVEAKTGSTDQMVRIYSLTGSEHDADLSFALDNGTGETFTIGIDDSDADKFKISDSATLGTNDRVVIDSTGDVAIAGGVTANVTGDVTGNVTGSSGSTTGNAATATALETARTIGGTSFDGTANITPANITVADTTDATCNVALFESATGDLPPKTDAGITYDATTGTLTSTGFSGPLTGDVTGNVSGTAATVTGATQSAITGVGTLTDLSVSGQLTLSDDLFLDGADQRIVFEGSTADAYEMFFQSTNPTTADRVVTLPDATGTVALQELSLNNQTGTAYTLVLADGGKVVEMNNASANTVTVPPNSSVAFPVGTQILVVQQGAGQTTIAGAGVTFRSKDSNLKITGQYSSAALIKRATDEWYVVGDLSA